MAALPDLVLVMDESHRYRASAGVRAINELKPILGLELTATPFVESARGPVPFKNVVYDYPLARAMADGFVKEPAVVTRKNFDPSGMSGEQVERLKLEDGVRLHEATKVELETYARESGRPVVKPFLLAIARDTTHAGELVALVESDGFFDGRYKGKVIQVDSSRTGVEEEKMVARLLKVEHGDEPTEIVVHVNMLKEGWDVTNLYTIVPLRAANARTLIEQSIGRGLRLPYGARTGVAAVDRLSIVAHDRFQEIVDEANRPDSAIKLQAIVLDPDDFGRKTESIVVAPSLSAKLGLGDTTVTHAVDGVERDEPPVFVDAYEKEIATITYEVIRSYESRPDEVPTVEHLKKPEIREAIVRAVEERQRPQGELEGVVEKPDVADIVSKTVNLVAKQTIDIPRIHVVPKGEVRSGFKPFTLDLSAMRYAAVSDDLWLQYLRTGGSEVVATGPEEKNDGRPEDVVVAGLMEFDDVSYDDEADLLYELAGQVVAHLRSYLADPEVGKVLRCHSQAVARFVHVQMQAHRWEVSDAGYEVKVSRGFQALKECAYSRDVGDPVRDFRQSPDDKSHMVRYFFGGFRRCLYPVQKFGSDPERIMAVILDRDSSRWCRPVKGQFQLFYRDGADHGEYQPDFVAEDADAIYMVEVKAVDEMTDPVVLAKKDVAALWCGRATDFSAKHGGKPWRYLLIPHDAVAENMTLAGLAATKTHN